MSTKKTLVVKISTDVTGKSDILIEMHKSLIRQSLIEGGMENEDISFEVLVSNEETALASMLKAVQSEFQAASAALFAEQATADEVAEAEKSDGFGDFLRLVMAADEDEDDEAAAVAPASDLVSDLAPDLASDLLSVR